MIEFASVKQWDNGRFAILLKKDRLLFNDLDEKEARDIKDLINRLVKQWVKEQKQAIETSNDLGLFLYRARVTYYTPPINESYIYIVASSLRNALDIFSDLGGVEEIFSIEKVRDCESVLGI